MPVEKSHARLGAFLVVVLLLAIATGLLFVQRARTRAVLDLVTYTTENISGLDVSSPVRLRGVPVGRVTELRVDPLGKTVEIGTCVHFFAPAGAVGASRPSAVRARA